MKKRLSIIICKFFFFFLFVILSGKIVAQVNYTVSRFDNTWCTTVFPTAYATGSWSITELNSALGGNNGFSKTQNHNGTTMIVDLPANFEFNTAAASTITLGGT